MTLFSLGLIALLIGARFDFLWAGGEGEKTSTVSITHQEGSADIVHDRDTRHAVIGETLVRGEIVETDEGFLRLTIGEDISIILAERTTLVLEDMSIKAPSLKLLRGRIIAEQSGSFPLLIKTNFTSVDVQSGTITMVNYDFLETVMIAPYPQAQAMVMVADIAFPLEHAVSVHETSETTVSDTSPSFDFPFYTWAQEISK
jgi:hypothetical protein